MEKTSRQWYDEYLHWGGVTTICDPDGWDRRNWDFSWCKERITAEEFLSRAMRSTLMADSFRGVDYSHGTMLDLEYYFTCVVREGDDCDGT